MFLKRVELNGFKSFPDKTVFDFADGITAILGPNGCGKSNVVDAIKWVLGETSAKNLRGQQMMDVIFAGSERRKAVGMAEVHLFFDNSDGKLPVEYNEVCITRRLYRSGESEYMMNRTPCRKRDIRDMLLDTGVGTSAYSVIEQGKVEALLQAKPHERRLVFEEAAGISKYKQRRKETLARLDRTNQYLFRVNDIVEEVEKNIRRVGRQASSARRYQRLKTEMDLLKTHFYARRYQSLQEQMEKVLGEAGEISQLLTQESARQAELSSVIAEFTQQEISLSTDVESRESAAMAIMESLAKVQAELSGATERIHSLEREGREAVARAEQLRERLQGMQTDETAVLAEQSEAKAALEAVAESMGSMEAKRTESLAAFNAAEERIETIRRDIQSQSDRRDTLLSSLARLDSEEQGLADRVRELGARDSTLLTQEETLAAQVTELQATLDRVAESVQSLNEDVTKARATETRNREEAERRNQQISDMKSMISAKDSRRATLEDLENNLAGTHKGVKAVLSAHKDGEPACREIRGMIADLLTVPQDVAVAIETAVGAQAQEIVVETARGAQACIEYLKRNRAGRATFLPLDRIRPRSRLKNNLCHIPGVLGDAVDLVEFASEFRPAVEYVLAGVLVVESLELARQLSGTEARGIRIVTLQGEVINARGAMTGGEGHQSRGGLITRKAEMEALATELIELGTTLESASRARDLAITAIREAADEAGTLEKALAEAARNGQRIEKDLSVRQSELNRLQSDKSQILEEQASLEEKRTAMAGRRAECETEQRALAEQAEERGRRLETETEAQKASRGTMETLNEECAVVRETRATAQSRVDELNRRLLSLRESLEERQSELRGSEEFSARAEAETQSLTGRLETLHEQERELLVKRDSARESGTGLRQNLQSLRETLNGHREQERAIQKRLGEIAQAENQLKLRENECRMKLESVCERAREELQIEDFEANVESILSEQVEMTLTRDDESDSEDDPDALRAEVRESITEDAEGGIPRMSEEQMRTMIEDIAAKIGRIGPVNMYAIDELTELEARGEFLSSEQEDLESASNDLLQVIERLNDECSRRFEETFVTVRENFQEMFRKLFGGGKADLVLEEVNEAEGGDRLNAGIDIIARPPGKEPKSISLLSGGEKALCAVALLFAIFRSKPSPFCILDEVDGPLDESNIDRFMNAVKEFSVETQFILISHAKRTMSMTDMIYGITQNEPGISTKYSLKFTDMHEEAVNGKKEADVPEMVAAG